MTDITKIKKIKTIPEEKFDQYVKKGWVLLHVTSEHETTFEKDIVEKTLCVIGHE